MLELDHVNLLKEDSKTCTIFRDVDVWYACISAESEDPQKVDPRSAKPSVGVDLGIENLATLSDGRKFKNPRTLDLAAARIKITPGTIIEEENGFEESGRKLESCLRRLGEGSETSDWTATHKISAVSNYRVLDHSFRGPSHSEYGQESPSCIGNNGCPLGENYAN